jgi:hypothetical protein
VREHTTAAAPLRAHSTDVSLTERRPKPYWISNVSAYVTHPEGGLFKGWTIQSEDYLHRPNFLILSRSRERRNSNA